MSIPSSVGRYRIDRVLGSGAFASVWLGHDEALAAPVAIKVLSGSLLDDLDVRNRFLEEARILRRADSERLVRVHDIGDLPDGRPYFVMSYADRGTLSDRMRARPLAVHETLALAEEIAYGVEVINRLGVIHRDLKPSNVLFQSTPDGGERLLIADLGLAKAIAHASGAFTLPVGTPGYMSPEQARFGGGLDVRADVYGLGALTYHMLTGKAPGPAPVRVKPSELRMELPPGTDEVILRTLAVDREQRFPTAEAFARALATLRQPGGAGSMASGAPFYGPRSGGPGFPEPATNPDTSPEDDDDRTVRDRPQAAAPDEEDDRTVRDRPRGSAPAEEDRTVAISRDQFSSQQPPPEGATAVFQNQPPPQHTPDPRQGAGAYGREAYGAPGQQGGPGGQYGGPGQQSGPAQHERTDVYGAPGQQGGPGQYGAPGPYGGPGQYGAPGSYGGHVTPPTGSPQVAWQGGPPASGTGGTGGTGGARDGQGKGHKRLVVLGIVVAIVLLAVAGGLLLGKLRSDGKTAQPTKPEVPQDFAAVADPSGKIRAAVPKAWRALETPATWRPSEVGLTDPAARPVLRATPGTFQEFLSPTAKVPGVFIGITTDVAQGKLPPVRASAHDQCAKGQPERYTSPDKALTGTITRYTGCKSGVPTITEVGLADRGGKFGVWIRVKEVDGRGATTDILNNLKLTGP